MELGGEIAVKVIQKGLPVHIALLHLVQPLLHLGGEGIVHNVVELVFHQPGDHLPQRGGTKGLALLDHILPIQDGGDGGSVGGGPADALLLQGPDQGRHRVAGGGLGKVLVLLQPPAVQGLPLLQVRQGGGLLLLVLVLPLLIDGGEAGELQAGVAGPENISAVLHVDRQAVIDGVCHLAGEEPAPNQLVQLVLLARQVLLDLVRDQGDIRGADGLVGVLGVALGLESPGLGGVIFPAVPMQNKVLGGSQSFLRQAEGVGTHIGDEAHGPLSGQLHALIQLLGDGHSTGRGHIQLAGRLLLEGGGGEGRGGLA